MQFESRIKINPSNVIIVSSGILIGITLLGIFELHIKYVFGLIMVIPLSFTFSKNVKKYIIAMFILFIPISLNISPFHLDPNHPPEYHPGGAQSYLEIWVSQIPLLWMLIYWAIEIAVKRQKILFTPIDIIAILFIVWNAISIFNSANIMLSLFHLLRLLEFYATYVLLINIISDKNLTRFVVNALLAGLIIQGAIAIMQYWFDLPLKMESGGIELQGTISDSLNDIEIRRVFGTVGFPNTFGLYISMILPLAFASIISNYSFKNYWSTISFGIGAIALLLTFSRGAWISSFLALLIVILIMKKARAIRNKIQPIIFGSMLLIVLVGLILMKPIYHRITASPDGTSIDRVYLMKAAIEMIAFHPIIGVGLNTFSEVLPKYDFTGVSKYFQKPVHNYFLLIAAEVGITGLILFIIFIGITLSISFKTLKRLDEEMLPVLIGCLSGVIACLVANIVDCTLRSYTTGQAFCVLLALIGVCWLSGNKK